MSNQVLWRNAFGEAVDLDTIDREYALNILSMHIARKVRIGWLDMDFRNDPLTTKLREVVLHGRDRDGSDSLREAAYNMRSAARGMRFRAPS